MPKKDGRSRITKGRKPDPPLGEIELVRRRALVSVLNLIMKLPRGLLVDKT
jgi:hypothetical protein